MTVPCVEIANDMSLAVTRHVFLLSSISHGYRDENMFKKRVNQFNKTKGTLVLKAAKGFEIALSILIALLPPP